MSKRGRICRPQSYPQGGFHGEYSLHWSGCSQEKIAVNAGYNNRSWLDGYLKLVVEAGLDIAYAENFVDQGFFKSEVEMSAKSFIFPEVLAAQSMERALSAAPQVDAILLMGMPSWKTIEETTIRTHAIVDKLETKINKTIISGDIALFWAIFHTLGITPNGMSGELLHSLENPCD